MLVYSDFPSVKSDVRGPPQHISGRELGISDFKPMHHVHYYYLSTTAARELCLHPSNVYFGSELLSKGFHVTQLSSINVVKGKARLCETLFPFNIARWNVMMLKTRNCECNELCVSANTIFQCCLNLNDSHTHTYTLCGFECHLLLGRLIIDLSNLLMLR